MCLRPFLAVFCLPSAPCSLLLPELLITSCLVSGPRLAIQE
jgi:hypothetical protein